MKTPQVDHGVIHDGQEITTPLGMKRKPQHPDARHALDDVLLVKVTTTDSSVRPGDHAQDYILKFLQRCLWRDEDGSITVLRLLEDVFAMQGNNPRGEKIQDDQPTMSVGDLISFDKQYMDDDLVDAHVETLYFLVAPVGFIPIKGMTLLAWQALGVYDRPFFARELSRIKTLR